MRFLNQHIVVTGGASGIGQACVKLLLEEGAFVYIIDHIKDESLEANSRVISFCASVDKEADWEYVTKIIRKRNGTMDALIQCAGITSRDKVEHGTYEQWNSIMNINAFGAYLGMKHCIPFMKVHGGAIVNVASVGAMVGIGGGTAYPASKGALISMTRRIAIEYGGFGIRVNCVSPGWIHTPMTESAREEKREQFLNRQALKTIGTPIQVAHAILFLASEEASFISGVNLPVDGGFTAG